MEDLEFINSRFFAIYAKSELLSDLFSSHCLFNTYEDMNFGWAVKGDSFFGEDEVEVDYNHVLSCDKNGKFDFCKYFITLLEKHIDVGLTDYEMWLEGIQNFLNIRDPYFTYDRGLFEFDMDEVINILKENRKEINKSIESFCIMEFNVIGEDEESNLDVFSFSDGEYRRETLSESDINAIADSDCFIEDVISGEADMDYFRDQIVQKYT